MIRWDIVWDAKWCILWAWALGLFLFVVHRFGVTRDCGQRGGKRAS